VEWKRKPVVDEMRNAKTNGNDSGLAGWLLGWIRGVARTGLGNLQRGRGQRRMELVETLQLGGKRQLMLVVCDGQRYLVGAGGDAIGSIEAIAPRQVEDDGRVLGVESDDANGFATRRTQ
jgi:hypothetical protein